MEQRGPGARLGPYRLVQQIGEGGMGVVHLALDPADRAVALKVLRPHIAGDSSARERLRREVAVLQRVRHRLVAEVLDADPDGPLPYVVTQFVPGRSLEEHVREEGPLAPAALARLADGLGQALAAVHDAGVVHRDLKPANVLMLDGDPVVIDFGIAKVADDPRLTSADLVMGTPGYLAPELVEGAEVGPAADWWGWAATTAYAATGRPPFGRGPWPVVLDRVRRGEADLDGVPAPLVPLLAAALSPDVAARPREGWLRRGVQDLAASARSRAPEEAGPSDGDAVATSALARMAGPGLDEDMSGAGTGERRATGSHPVAEHDDPGAEDPGAEDPGAEDPGTDDAGGRDADEEPTTALLVQAPPLPPAPEGDRPGREEPTSAVAVGATSALPRRHEPGGRASTEQEPTEQWSLGPGPSDRWAPDPWDGGASVARTAEVGVPTPAQHPGAYADPGAGEDSWRRSAGHPPPTDPWRGAEDRWGAPAGALPAPPRRPDRPGLRAAWGAALVGVTALVPVVGVLVGLAVVVLARTVEGSHRWVLRRREVVGPRRGDVPLAVVRSPLPLLAALVTGVLSLLLPLAVAAAVVFLTGVLLADASVVPGDPVSLAAGAAAGLVTAWWGPGGSRLRRGAVLVSRAAPTGAGGTALVVVGLLVVAAAVWLAVTGTTPDWAPLPSPLLEL